MRSLTSPMSRLIATRCNEKNAPIPRFDSYEFYWKSYSALPRVAGSFRVQMKKTQKLLRKRCLTKRKKPMTREHDSLRIVSGRNSAQNWNRENCTLRGTAETIGSTSQRQLHVYLLKRSRSASVNIFSLRQHYFSSSVFPFGIESAARDNGQLHRPSININFPILSVQRAAH